MQKKGQAAMEFLMTYGWAILAAVIAIGVLAYFGVFSPGKYTTGSAVVNPPFYVNAQNLKAFPTNQVTLELKNNGGEEYNIQSVVISGCGTYSTPTSIIEGNSTIVSVTCTDLLPTGLEAGKTFKGDITINYQKTGSTVDLTSTGTISGKVVA